MPCRKLTLHELENLNPKPQGFDLQTDCENSTGCGCPEGQMRFWETIAELSGWSTAEECRNQYTSPNACDTCVSHGVLGACCGFYTEPAGMPFCYDFSSAEGCAGNSDPATFHPGKWCKPCRPDGPPACCP